MTAEIYEPQQTFVLMLSRTCKQSEIIALIAIIFFFLISMK